MEYIIHLTRKCNLNCKYCYEKKQNKDIKFKDIQNLIDGIIGRKEKQACIYFYGGEPLLKKDFIYKTIDYINSKKCKTKFKYGITTNGILLDKEDINFFKKNNFSIVALSIDGIKKVHDLNRKTVNGKGSFSIVEKNAKLLLDNIENVIAMCVVTKNNIEYLAESVQYLINLGFYRINLQFNYLDKWNDSDLKTIREEYTKVANIYATEIKEEHVVEIPIFDEKIKTFIDNKYDCNFTCKMGRENVCINVDGNFYPCMQFIGDKNFIIGNCKEGIYEETRENIITNTKKENTICKECAIRNRCKHLCGCKNYNLTNKVNEISPLICETEKIFIDVADEMAEKLYKENSKLFLQKFYNKNFLIMNSISRKFKK